MEIVQLLKKGYDLKASDLHLSYNQLPLIRLDGRLTPIEHIPLKDEDIQQFIKEYVTSKNMNHLEQEGDCDFSFSLDFSRFRVNIFKSLHGLSIAFRYIPSQIRTLDEIGAPSILKSLCNTTRGLILVTGATGSGKSTTLAALIDHINNTERLHIITIEDPIEFVHKSKKSYINQREIKTNCSTFSQALKASLREDPDIILIAELRDLESIRLALTAAETGHLVLGSLHTSSAIKTVDRIVDVFPEHEKNIVRMMLSESLLAVISQALIPRASMKGRIAAHEIMIANHAIRNLIRENKLTQILSIMQTSQNIGMTTCDQTLKELLKQGIISQDDAIKYAQDKKNF